MSTVAEKKRLEKLRAIRRLLIKAACLAAEVGASAVIVSLSEARSDLEATIEGKLSG